MGRTIAALFPPMNGTSCARILAGFRGRYCTNRGLENPSPSAPPKWATLRDEAVPTMNERPTDGNTSTPAATGTTAIPPTLVRSPTDLRRMFFLISVGLFITSLGQPGIIGQLPFLFLFKNEFHFNAAEQANFFAIATFAWYLKPLAGLLCDSFPLLGTRRRSYLILATAVAGLAWALFAVAPRSYASFFWLMVLLNCAIVIASTTIGGILVETAQAGHSTGRLASVRYGLDGLIGVMAGPLGGWLATRAFGWTAGIGALLMFSLVPLTMLLLKEPRGATRNLQVWAAAALQFRLILRSKTMWAAASLLLLVFMAPGFGIVLVYYQNDVLHFSTQFIGRLQALSGLGGILATVLYAYLCGKVSLKPLLLGGILLNAVSSILYLWYRSPESAMVIDTANGFLAILGILPLFDLAARATPKGSESFGYALLMGVYNVAVFAISYPIGSWLYELPGSAWHHSLTRLIWLNSGTSLIALVLVPFLPRILLAHHDGEKPKEA
jgi:predicted MFS family arabinose efflux permease